MTIRCDWEKLDFDLKITKLTKKNPNLSYAGTLSSLDDYNVSKSMVLNKLHDGKTMP